MKDVQEKHDADKLAFSMDTVTSGTYIISSISIELSSKTLSEKN